jgi:hypothetical protein
MLLETMNPAATVAFREVRTSGKFAGIGQDGSGILQPGLAKTVRFRRFSLVACCHVHTAPLPVNDHATSSATAMTTIAMYPNNDTLGERLQAVCRRELP